MVADAADILSTGLFDAAFYARTYGDIGAAGIDPAEHYARYGEAEGRRPNPYFDPADYAASVKGGCAAQSPLLHYRRVGEPAGIRPGPDFDPVWYREAYELPRFLSPLADFLRRRPQRDRLPSAALYAVPHLPRYRAMPSADDVFAQYLADPPEVTADCTAARIIGGSGLFDANHYLINGSDVHSAGLDPIEHFCDYGWREGRAPNIYFDTFWYLRTNEEATRLGINPLLHYVLQGEAGGRRPIVYFDPVWYRAAYAVPAEELALAHFLRHRRGQLHAPNARFDLKWYLQRNGRRIGRNRDPFAHFLQTGTYADVDPAPDFDAATHRARTRGRRTRHFTWRTHPDDDNPLIAELHATYR